MLMTSKNVFRFYFILKGAWSIEGNDFCLQNNFTNNSTSTGRISTPLFTNNVRIEKNSNSTFIVYISQKKSHMVIHCNRRLKMVKLTNIN